MNSGKHEIKVLHDYEEYTKWMRDDLLIDLLTDEEIVNFIKEERPVGFPCLAIFNDTTCSYKISYITQKDIDTWQTLLNI